jgi:hypothetical protein
LTNDIDDAQTTTRRAALIYGLGPVLLSACGGGSSEAPLPVAPPPVVHPSEVAPAISQSPVNATVLAGSAATFSVEVIDSNGAAYQWLRNGAELAGATASSLTYAPVSLLESGALFSVRVSKAAGSVTSQAATLTVTSPELTLIAGGEVTDAGPSRPALDGVGSAATFGRLGPVVVDDAGNLYVGSVATTSNATDATTAIRKVAPDGTVTPFAGVWGESASVDGLGLSARFVNIIALSFDRNLKMLLVVDRTSESDLRICEVTLAAEVTTRQVVAATRQFHGQVGVAWLPDGAAYIAGGSLSIFQGLTFQLVPTAVFKFARGGTPVLLAGDPQVQGYDDGVGTNARFTRVGQMAADAAGNVYVIDGSRLRRITPDGTVETIAGVADQFATAVDGQGSSARFITPTRLVVEDTGNILVLDAPNLIRRVTPDGRVITIARILPPTNPTPPGYDLAMGETGRLYVRGGGAYSGSGGWVGLFDPFPA